MTVSATASKDSVGEIFARAITLHQSHQLDAAQRLYSQVLERDPQHAHALHSMGAIAYVRGRHSDAIDMFQRAVAAQPNEVVFCHGLAQALRTDPKRINDAIALLHKALSINPEFLGAWQALAEIHYSLNDTEQAARAMRKVAELQTKTAESYNQQGISLAKENHLPEAIAAFQAGIACNPQGAGLYYNLGNVLIAREQFSDAISSLVEASQLSPQSPEVYVSLSNAHFSNGDLASALKAQSHALALSPELPQALFRVNASPIVNPAATRGASGRVASFAPAPPATVTVSIAQALQRAVERHNAGDLASAEALYRKVLEVDRENMDALHLFGVILHQRGDHRGALELIDRAILRSNGSASLYSNRALILAALEELEAAEASCKHALDIDSTFAAAKDNLALDQRHPRAHNLGGYRNSAQGDNASQKAKYSKTSAALQEGSVAQSVKQNESVDANAMAHAVEAQALGSFRLGRLEEALDKADTGIAKGLETAELQNLRGNILSRRGLTDQSAVAYARAASLNPNMGIARCNLGLAYQELGAIDRAIDCWESLVSAIPSYTDGYIALALARMNRSEFTDAEALLRRAITINAHCTDAHLNLGLLLHRTDRLEEALGCYRMAIQLSPSMAEAHVNLGALYHRQRLPRQASECFIVALGLNPNLKVAEYNLAQALLLQGDLEEGWRRYEARFAWLEARGAAPRSFTEPRWQGDDPAGRTILLVAEQGLGDSMQFIRYAPDLAARGARVMVEAQPEVAELLRTVEGVSEVFSRGTQLPKFDAFCPLMSLPLAFRTTLNTIPNKVPYVRADPALTDLWKSRLGTHTHLRVGLCWAGNPRRFDHDLAETDRRRSIPISTFLPILDVPGTRIYSLQKDVPACVSVADAQAFNALVSYPSELKDFADTAAYVENLDLVISVDTSVAHLAGALGKPVWVLSRFDGCWRWMMDREDSPWYPTARVWRQQTTGDWLSLVKRVRIALEHFEYLSASR